jgi:hypothetical protein
MNSDASVKIFKLDTYLLLNPSGRMADTEGRHGSDKIVKVGSINAVVLGEAVQALLKESSILVLAKDNPALERDRYVTTTVAEMAGLTDFADLLRHAKLVEVHQYGNELDISHSDRTSEKYRLHPNLRTLASPTAVELGTELLAAFERCTDS